MTTHKYILNAKGQPQIEPDLMTWAHWMENRDRIVCQEWVGDSRVSTIFLGLDHNYSSHGPPVLWETMVFNGRLNGETSRCAGSQEQAAAMHATMVQKVKAADKTAIKK